jgi:1,4-dihydroxy-2-naphthoate octaprenyltransferase
MTNKQMNVTGLLIASIIVALVLCAMAAWLTRTFVLLLPALALLPGLAYTLRQRRPGGRREGR